MRRNRPLLPAARKPKHTKVRSGIRWGLYLLLIFGAVIVATAGDYTKPLLLIPIALCISSVHNEVVAGAVGIGCGLLMDMTSGTLMGYHGILLFLICMAASRLYDRLLMQRFWNHMIFTLLAAFVVTGSDYIFQYAIWGYENVSYLYVHYSLPCLGYTVIGGGVLYPIFWVIHRYLLPKRRRKVERTLKPMQED